MTSKTIKAWLIKQDSYDYKPKPDSIKVLQDPKVRDTWAVQFEDEAHGETVHLMFVCGGEQGSDEEILENCLEEIEFDTWPPKSGDLKFFW